MKSVAYALLALSVASVGTAAEPVRVMSFNIRYGTAKDGDNHWDKRKEFLAETVATFDPDLLGTQETLAFQRDFLAEKMKGFEHVAAGRDDGKETGEMAALFFRRARFERTAEGHFWLSHTPDVPGSKGWDAALPRIATWVKLKDRKNPSEKPVLFLNTHFDHMGKTARAESATLIRKRIAEIGDGCRWVVTGDFNAGEGSGPYQSLFGVAGETPSPIVDTFRVAVPERGKAEGTFNGFKPASTGGERIDWIGCSRDWDVRLAAIDRMAKAGRTPSDHFPVTAVLRAAVPGRKPTVRVLSYNIHHGEGTDGKVDLPRLARVIRAADPDLVAVQEVDDRTIRTNDVDQTAELARLTGLHGQFGKQIDYEGGGYGQAILSRVPLGRGTVHWLPGEPDRERRIAFAVPVTLFGRDLTFVTTHLHHQKDEFRQRQAAEMNAIFAGTDRPVLVAGDLNANPDSRPLDILMPRWAVATGPGRHTYPAGRPTKQIDYVLARPASRFASVELRVPDEPVASDHRPLLAVYEFRDADPESQTPAFPGAEGFGRFAKGGRGGDVYHVTTLNDAGPGSFRDGIATATGPRTIVFDVSGTIELKSKLVVDKSFLTIAGQTAPGDGVCLKDQSFQIRKASHVIVRYLRVRLGDENKTKPAGFDAMTTDDIDHVIIDRVSVSWGIDGLHDLRRGGNVTVQWCLYAEALHDSLHEKGPHAMLASFRDLTAGVSIHHNLFASSRERHPTLGGSPRTKPGAVCDFRNNVVYNASGATNLGNCRINVVNNYYRPGPNAPANHQPLATKAEVEGATRAYLAGNVFEGNEAYTQDNFKAVDFARWSKGGYLAKTLEQVRSVTEFELGEAKLDTHEATTARDRVLLTAGASLRRDATDARIVAGVRDRSHRMINSQKDVGGWPKLKSGIVPADADGDGMSDWWEKIEGLNEKDPADRNSIRPGQPYTNLERYLNGLCR
jgi:endonuclease/exonuclease/phosphatase family metal-dependent hydrolase/pectate lyase